MSKFFAVHSETFEGLQLRFGGVIEVFGDMEIRDLFKDPDFAILQYNQDWKSRESCTCLQGAYFMAYTDEAGDLQGTFRRPPLALALIAMFKLPSFPRAVFTCDGYLLTCPETRKPYWIALTPPTNVGRSATGKLYAAGLCKNAN